MRINPLVILKNGGCLRDQNECCGNGLTKELSEDSRSAGLFRSSGFGSS